MALLFALPKGSKVSDTDTSQILLIHTLSGTPKAYKSDLDKIKNEVLTWQAWESGRAEEQVQKKVQVGQLPGDNSPASELKRNAYRMKVLEYLRDNSSWISVNSSSVQDRPSVVDASGFRTGVLREILLGFNLKGTAFQQFEVVLKAMCQNLAAGEIENYKLFVTLIAYVHNSISSTYEPVISTFYLNLNVTKASADACLEEQDQFNVNLTVSKKKQSFSLSTWQSQGHLIDQKVVDVGKVILQGKSMNIADKLLSKGI